MVSKNSNRLTKEKKNSDPKNDIERQNQRTKKIIVRWSYVSRIAAYISDVKKTPGLDGMVRNSFSSVLLMAPFSGLGSMFMRGSSLLGLR